MLAPITQLIQQCLDLIFPSHSPIQLVFKLNLGLHIHQLLLVIEDHSKSNHLILNQIH